MLRFWVVLLAASLRNCGSSFLFQDIPSPSGYSQRIGHFELSNYNTIFHMNPWFDTARFPIDFQYDDPEICSDLHFVGFHELTGAYHFSGVSDDGPQVENEFCQDRYFKPLPQYASTISNFHLSRTNSATDRFVEGEIVIDRWVPLQSNPAIEIIAMHPTKPSYFDDICMEQIDTGTFLTPISQVADGMDPEGIVRLSTGQYVIVEEYGPSMAIIDPSGVVQIRYLPEGRAKDFGFFSYSIREIFPEITISAKGKRGFEALALSNDEKTVWIMLQSPIKPAIGTQMVRVYKVDISDPLNAQLTAVYLYKQTSLQLWETLTGDVDENDEIELKTGAIEWISDNRLLVVERNNEEFIIYSTDFTNATNILADYPTQSNDEDNPIESLVESLRIRQPQKSLILKSSHVALSEQTKIEGLAILGNSLLAICYDNDLKVNAELDIIQLAATLDTNAAEENVETHTSQEEKCSERCAPFNFVEPQYDFVIDVVTSPPSISSPSPPAPPSPKSKSD